MDENERVIRNFIEAWSRLDRTRADDKPVDLPCVGVFELEAGKIKVWRDYYDLATYQKGLA
jgi:limonene-1,2-epoxide hydrolase